MKKKFNITGVCFPQWHYMMKTEHQIGEVLELIESGVYFTINRPRQYGKTTTMYTLVEQLGGEKGYLVIDMSFEGTGKSPFATENSFSEMLVNDLIKELKRKEESLANFLKKQLETATKIDFKWLSEVISLLVEKSERKFVLMIDEIDASSNHEIFLYFLAMLRTKYLQRAKEATFHSIVLAGVHDTKTLKYKVRGSKEAKYNSPWNIAVDFEVRMSFIPSEIVPMLEEYSEAEKVGMNFNEIAELLYYHTSGYPFLVSRLCKIIAEKLMKNKQERIWRLEDVETAVALLLKENNTNFDSLIKNLEHNPSLYGLVKRVIIEGESLYYNPDEPIMYLGKVYGIFKNSDKLQIHNRLYEQRIYNYMTAKMVVAFPRGHNYSYHFMTEDDGLDMKAVLLKFQQFMKEQYSDKQKDFIEHEGRVIFLGFLSPILNGQGFAFREVQTSLEKRLDVVVTYLQHRYIIELKRWYGEKAHEKGLTQLVDYLDIHSVKEGFLVIFDDRKEKPWASEHITHKGKNIFAVWV